MATLKGSPNLHLSTLTIEGFAGRARGGLEGIVGELACNFEIVVQGVDRISCPRTGPLFT